MLTHETLWNALDRLAERHGLTSSGLARAAGLDPTSFNRSKRLSADGRERWPSTESLAKVLEFTGCSLSELEGLIVPHYSLDSSNDGSARLPLFDIESISKLSLVDIGNTDTPFFSESLQFPNDSQEKCFAVEITGNVFAPLYSRGTLLILSSEGSLRRNDAVLVKLKQTTMRIFRFMKETGLHFELAAAQGEAPPTHLRKEEVEWIARIIWASQ